MRKEAICEVSVNINDMTGEEISFLLNLAMDEGAKDAYAMPIFRRNRNPAHLVTILCSQEDTTIFCELLLKHSTAFDLRVEMKHYISLKCEMDYAETSLGVVRVYRTGRKIRIEYDDLARLAKRNGISIAAVRERIVGEINS